MNPTPMEFVTLVVKTYNEGHGVFTVKANAEDLIPEGCTPLETAQFLFYVIQLDYATKSQRLYRGAIELWQKDKSFFEPNSIRTQSIIYNVKKLWNQARADANVRIFPTRTTVTDVTLGISVSRYDPQTPKAIERLQGQLLNVAIMVWSCCV